MEFLQPENEVDLGSPQMTLHSQKFQPSQLSFPPLTEHYAHAKSLLCAPMVIMEKMKMKRCCHQRIVKGQMKNMKVRRTWCLPTTARPWQV
jgi:hypothetical protein